MFTATNKYVRKDTDRENGIYFPDESDTAILQTPEITAWTDRVRVSWGDLVPVKDENGNPLTLSKLKDRIVCNFNDIKRMGSTMKNGVLIERFVNDNELSFDIKIGECNRYMDEYDYVDISEIIRALQDMFYFRCSEWYYSFK